MSEQVNKRSVEVVTAEIITIREHAQKVFYEAVIQIGRRLEEAKSLVPAGTWLEYLDGRLGYKPSTAQNYMRIAREFGDGQLSLTNKNAADLFGNLGYSQLLPLLGLPEDEREQLAEENDLQTMSKREIDALVRERDAAKKQAADNKALLDKQHKGLIDAKVRADALKTDLAAAKKQAEQERLALQDQLTALEAKAAEPITAEVVVDDAALARVRDEVAAEQAEAVRAAQARAAEFERKYQAAKNPEAAQVNFLFGEMQTLYSRLGQALLLMDDSQPETADKLRGAIAAQLNTWAASVGTDG